MFYWPNLDVVDECDEDFYFSKGGKQVITGDSFLFSFFF